jgi:hypothetical protein
VSVCVMKKVGEEVQREGQRETERKVGGETERWSRGLPWAFSVVKAACTPIFS